MTLLIPLLMRLTALFERGQVKEVQREEMGEEQEEPQHEL